MDTHTRYETPEIGQHAALPTGRDRDAETATRSSQAKPKTTVDFGDGWYHDAAIADAKEARANPYH